MIVTAIIRNSLANIIWNSTRYAYISSSFPLNSLGLQFLHQYSYTRLFLLKIRHLFSVLFQNELKRTCAVGLTAWLSSAGVSPPSPSPHSSPSCLCTSLGHDTDSPSQYSGRSHSSRISRHLVAAGLYCNTNTSNSNHQSFKKIIKKKFGTIFLQVFQ